MMKEKRVENKTLLYVCKNIYVFIYILKIEKMNINRKNLISKLGLNSIMRHRKLPKGYSKCLHPLSKGEKETYVQKYHN